MTPSICLKKNFYSWVNLILENVVCENDEWNVKFGLLSKHKFIEVTVNFTSLARASLALDSQGSNYGKFT